MSRRFLVLITLINLLGSILNLYLLLSLNYTVSWSWLRAYSVVNGIVSYYAGKAASDSLVRLTTKAVKP